MLLDLVQPPLAGGRLLGFCGRRGTTKPGGMAQICQTRGIFKFHPTTAVILIEIARLFIAVAFFAIAIALLWARLIPAAHTMARIGKRIGG
jgi:hypothetical protein